MSMIHLVTDNPQNNTENMLNLVFVKDKEVWVRYGGEDGQDCPLTSFCKRMCNEYSECVYSSISFYETEDLDTIGDLLMDCSAEGCPIGTTYFAMIHPSAIRYHPSFASSTSTWEAFFKTPVIFPAATSGAVRILRAP